MASLKIPDRYKPGLVILAQLPDDPYRELLSAVQRAPKSFSNIRELVSWLSPEIKGVGSEDLSKVVNSISSLYRLASRRRVAIPKLAIDVLEGAQEGINGFKVAEGVDFIGRLTALLEQEAFDLVSFKARELQGESERTLCEARVLTDVRPIFGEKIEDSPTGMIITHTLKLVYHEMTGHKELYVALDDDDIASLTKILQRAGDKARSLRALLTAKDLHPVDLA